MTERHARFISEQISDGHFANASEVMQAGLQLLERQGRKDEEKLAVLRALAAEGFAEIDQGRGIKLEGRRELEAFIGGLGRRAGAKAKRRRRAT